MTEKAIRIVTFTGKRDDWRQWSKKFLAVTERREYRMILETDKEELEVTGDDRKKKNSAAYNDLLLAMTDDVSFGLVDEASSTDYPEGDARVAWSKLMQSLRARPMPRGSSSWDNLVVQNSRARIKILIVGSRSWN